MTTKLLDGVKIIELANYVAAPVVGRICADMGATVIKIEGRFGDPWRTTAANLTKTGQDENPIFDMFNAGKKSISLNLKSAGGKKILYQLLEDADILITNTRERSLVKLGLNYDALKERFPRLIYAALTGYGPDGPDRDAPGFDNIAFWSRPGFLADMSIKAQGSYPVNTRGAMGDVISGTTLFGGVMAALYQREKTGRGDFVTMSLYNAGIWAMGGCLVMAEKPYCHEFPEPRLSGNPMNLVYQCSDKRWVRCTIFEYDRYAAKFFGALGVQAEMDKLGVHDMISLAGQAERAIPIFEQSFAQKQSSEWLAVFKELDIVCGLLNHFADVFEDEQALANHYIQEYRCKNGRPCMITTVPVRLGSQGVPKIGEPVSFAEHNNVILNQLGYTDEDIAELKRSEVIYGL